MVLATSHQTGGELAIVAEDDQFMAEMMATLLREHGIATDIASDGEEAIRLIELRPPHLLLLDLLMPRADGYHVLDYIREQKLIFPVIVISNLSLDLEKQQSLGVADFIVKSNVDEEELWSRVEKYFSTDSS